MNTKPPRATPIPPNHKAAHFPASASSSRSALRNQLRAQRQNLSASHQRDAAKRFARNLARHTLFRCSRHIAFYLAEDGELDPMLLLQRAGAMGKVCYLPVITPRQSLWFAPYAEGDPLALNRFGIPEPARPGLSLIGARALDLILTPLVAFDDQGHRLGMGGGFYDRTLSFLRQRHAWHKPRLLGVAHELQRVGALTAEPWDVPLDGVATDTRLYLFHNTSS